MLKALSSLFTGKPAPSSAGLLHGAVVAQARQPAFYRNQGVPDSLDGRFDMLVLHAFLVLRRLNGLGPEGQTVAQELSDLIFADMDGNLREIGVGDLSVGKKIKAMAKAFFGRLTAYESALNADNPDELTEALRRNLYGTVAAPEATHLACLAAYTRAADQALAGQGGETLLAGKLNFPPAP